MSESVGKSFKVPKIKRQENKDNLRQVEVSSRDALEIMNTVKRSYLETNYTTSWDLKAVMFVESRELEEKYRQKKIEMKDDGRRDLVDQYAYLLFKDSNIISQVVKDGIKCRGINFNGLGNSKLGVYLCRNADIQLRLAESWAVTAVTVMVFKVVQGKCKVIANNSADEGMEPTPNYDCHVFQQQPKPGEPLTTQLARSQVYFYEYTEDCEPSQYPRQCLPYAILAYTRPENIPAPVSQPQVDSYSKRPAGLADRGRTLSSDIETFKLGITEVKPSRRDPRRASGDVKMNPMDPRVAVAEAQGLNTGLCVPHLSAVPKPIVSDPRLTQSTSVQNTAFKTIVPGMPYPGYRPKFGPAEEELERQRQLEMVQQQLQNIQKQQGPGLNLPPLLDPRLARVDPRLDPRLRESRLSTENPQESQEVVTPHHSRHNSGSEDQYSKLKKKISLHDYKKKAPVPKPDPVSTKAPSQQVQSSSIYDSMKEMYQSSLQQSAAYYTSLPSSLASETYTNAQSDYTRPDMTPSSDDEPYDPESHIGESPKQEDDIVEEPEAMAKTLNELSDPDDVSQSPSTLEEHIENEQDPLLAAAMRKLVEHSGDVSLFTEALQSLQESAEEMGERLTDPEFLVKTIAEKIEELLKQKNLKGESQHEKEPSSAGVTDKVAAGVNDKIADDIQSPDAIRSPDITSKESCYTNSSLVRSIPLETQEIGVDNSALAQSMQKTLKELEMIEKNKQDLLVDNTNIDLASIPVPPFPKTKPGDSGDFDINKDNLTVEEMDIDSDEASCQEPPKQLVENIPQTHSKSISFNIKRTSISQDISANIFNDENNFEDKDERKNIKFLEQLKARDNKRETVKVDEEIEFGDEDVDLRKIVSNKRPITKIGDSYHTKKTEESYHTSKDEVDVSQDKDERVAPSNDLNSVFLDKDDRVNQTVNQPSSVFGLNEMGDRDDRVKSRSGSPVLQNQDIPMQSSQKIKIENSYTTSASVKSEMIKTESQSSEEGVGTLFDAYSIAENTSSAKKDEKMMKDDILDAEPRVENSFGDVDWRVAAAAEMGDVDLRSSQSSLRSNEEPGRSNEDLVKSSEDTLTGHEDDLDMRFSSSRMSQHADSSFSKGNPSEARQDLSEPFAKMNQSVQNILFSNNQKIEHYSTMSKPLDSYSTMKGSYETYSTHKTPVEAYNTSANFAGEYKTSGFQSSVPDPYSYPSTEQYSTSNIPASTSTQVPSIGGGIQNVMQNIDMFDLKNILARVGHAPPASEPTPVTVKPTFVEPTTPPSESDEDDTQNKPAFCTGLSFLKSKAPKVDLTRAKYTGKAKIAPDVGPPPVTPPVPAGVRNQDRLHSQDFEPPVPSLPGFPRFDSSPVKDYDARKPASEVTRLEGQPSNFFTLQAMFDRKTNVIPGFEGQSKTEIPGFEPIVDGGKEESKHSAGDTQGGSQPFRFSEEIPDRDFSSMWYVENPHIPESKREKKKKKDNDKSDTESDSRQSKRNKKREKGDVSDDSDVSPSKSRRKKDTPSKTEETESWQDAILESMEQSALKVRSEESFVADTEEPLSPTNDGKCVKALFVETNECSMDKKEAEVTSKPQDDDSDEESNLVIDLSPTQKKESEKKSVSKMESEEKTDAEDVGEVETGPESNDIAHPEEADVNDKQETNEADITNEESDKKIEEKILQDKEAEVTTKDEMKNFIEKKRKNIVIRLKGETKVVNPKTGKAYNENPVGSAIQVLGQPSKPQKISQSNVSKPCVSDESAKHIHPIHGIVSVGSKPGMKPTSSGGSSRYRSPSPVLQQAQISAISSGASGFQSISPINQISSIATVGTGQKTNEYIHPLTGQRMTYGKPQSVGQNIPVQGQTNPVNVLTGMPLQKLMPSPQVLQQPPYPVLPGSNPLVRPIGQVPGSFVQVSIPQGLPIQSLGSGASGQSNQHPPLNKDRRSSSDVYDWFSDKFNKRELDNRNYSKTADRTDVMKEPNYEVSQNSAIKVIKTDITANVFHRKSNIEVKIDPCIDSERKRRGYDDIGHLDSKKSRTDKPGTSQDTMAKVLEDHSIETLSKVKDVIQSTLATLNEPSSCSDKDPTDTAASSELEDGEISDDDDDDDDIPNIPVPTDPYIDSRRVMVYDQGLYPGMGSRIPSMGAMDTSSPKRIINLCHPQQMPIQTVGGGNVGNMHRVASDWSDMLADTDIRKVERVRSRNDPYLATRNASDSLDSDTSCLLSKSAASISKTKQKTIARSQVKTLGDWLKVELETENILPLQSIIPYSLNTDLTIIPKLRRRKIRQKVKNAIEQEGLKKMKIEIKPVQPSRPAINPNYLPEVNGEQLEKEMKLVSEYCSELRSQASSQQQFGQGDFSPSNPSLKTSLLVAFGTIEAEMKTLLQRTCFYGYPNRRVPNELLIESEFYSFRSEVEDVFLILMTPISSKPYGKLVLMKSELESLYRQKETASDQQAIDNSIRSLHMQRQALLRSFTGYLNKKRVNKLQDSVNKYTQVYEYLQSQQPPVPDTMMKYIRTTQMDLRQHLILAKQYLAMEEMKVDGK